MLPKRQNGMIDDIYTQIHYSIALRMEYAYMLSER